MDKRHVANLPDLLTPDEVMEYLQIGRNTTYKMLKNGLIPSIRIGKMYRTPKVMLVTALKSLYDCSDTLPKEGATA